MHIANCMHFWKWDSWASFTLQLGQLRAPIRRGRRHPGTTNGNGQTKPEGEALPAPGGTNGLGKNPHSIHFYIDPNSYAGNKKFWPQWTCWKCTFATTPVKTLLNFVNSELWLFNKKYKRTKPTPRVGSNSDRCLVPRRLGSATMFGPFLPFDFQNWPWPCWTHVLVLWWAHRIWALIERSSWLCYM